MRTTPPFSVSFRNLRSMAAVAALWTASAQAQFSLLHEFAGGVNDGREPYYSTPVVSGSTLYGLTTFGGDSDQGTLFQMNTDGSGFSLLHEFARNASDGGAPYGSLTLSGSTLYGLTTFGGAANNGTLFKINTDGSGYSLLRQFTGGVGDGRSPQGTLTLVGSTLYGTTQYDGAAGGGTLFKINTDGSGYGILHNFAGGANDGQYPANTSLTLSGSTLYGMTQNGGDSNHGTIFKINTDGSGYGLLREFAGGASDGGWPYGGLTLAGSTFYGMAGNGGGNDLGVVFKMNTDGSGFSIMHDFAGATTDGQDPLGMLTLSGSKLYGLTYNGGSAGQGTLFEMNTDGSGYNLLRNFAGGANDGQNPSGSLSLSGSTLYGMTETGGDNNRGVIFSFGTVPEPSASLLLAVGLAATASARRKKASGRR